MKYEHVDKLLKQEPEAKRYFDNLPDYVREQIRQRGSHVNSFASLKDYAQNLTRGDN